MKLYKHCNLPMHWVVERNGKFYLVPSVNRGWRFRIDYVGDGRRLREVDWKFALGLEVPAEEK
jgi:hypothetical protein